MHVKLVVASGKNASKHVDVKPGISFVGRAPKCHIRPTSPSVSRCHCAIIQAYGHVWLQDLDSLQGTYVNDNPLPPDRKRLLSDGDSITLGKARYLIQIERVDEEIADLLTDLDEADRHQRNEQISMGNRQGRLEIASATETVMDEPEFEETNCSDTPGPKVQGMTQNAAPTEITDQTKSAAVAGLKQMLSIDRLTSERDQPSIPNPKSTTEKKISSTTPAISKVSGSSNCASKRAHTLASKKERNQAAELHRSDPRIVSFSPNRGHVAVLAACMVLSLTGWAIYSNCIHDPSKTHILFRD